MPTPKLFVVIAIAMSAISLQSFGHAAKLTTDLEENVDHIVTGRQLSAEHLRRWHEARTQFDACGLCGSEQPFPGDEPVVQLHDNLTTGSIKLNFKSTRNE